MKIDLYSVGDPWNSNTWSGTSYELTTVLKNLGALGNAYDASPKRNNRKLSRIRDYLSYLRPCEGNICSVKAHHPRYIRALRKSAQEIHLSHPRPDAIMTIGDIAPFDEIPYFTFQDLDIATILNWRILGKKTYMFDHYPIDLLIRRRELQQEVYTKAKGIMVASKWVADSVRSYVEEPKKVHVIGIGHRYKIVETSESLLQRRFEHPIILFVGKDGFRKGLDIAFSAFKSLLEDIPEAEMKVVTNSGALPKDLRGRMKNCPNVVTYSNLPELELQDLYRSASVFLMPSRFEPWGKVFFEAMSFGMPVIGARCCAMPEFIIDGYNGYAVEYNSVAVADSVKNLLKSFDMYKKTSENAIKVSEKHTWNNTAKKMLKVIDDTIVQRFSRHSS